MSDEFDPTRRAREPGAPGSEEGGGAWDPGGAGRPGPADETGGPDVSESAAGQPAAAGTGGTRPATGGIFAEPGLTPHDQPAEGGRDQAEDDGPGAA